MSGGLRDRIAATKRLQQAVTTRAGRSRVTVRVADVEALLAALTEVTAAAQDMPEIDDVIVAVNLLDPKEGLRRVRDYEERSKRLRAALLRLDQSEPTPGGE